MNDDSLRYAGFWSRLGSILLDFIVLLPWTALTFWGGSKFRLFKLYFFVPQLLFWFFYSVYLVRRFGGTPGKLIMGIRIRKLDGESVGYREAILRCLPEMVMSCLISAAFIVALYHMSDAEYHSLSFKERSDRIIALAPSWYMPLIWAQSIWTWSEFIVLLTNRKKRALHDFIAGTVVVHNSPPAPAPTLEPPPVTA